MIHKTSVVDSKAKIAQSARIGPYSALNGAVRNCGRAK